MTDPALAQKNSAAPPQTHGLPVALPLYHEITLLLYREARMLDEERFLEWLETLTPDIHYWMPLRENRFRRDRRPEPGPDNCASVYNDDLFDLGVRIKRFETGMVWSEDPQARVSRLVTNIEVEHTERPDELAVFSNVAIYRNRRQDEKIWFNGKRRDRFRIVDGQWKLCRRHILVNHHVFLDENISLFF